SDHFWYLSEENSEPRRGRRGVDPGEDVELDVDVPGTLRGLRAILRATAPAEPLAWVLLEHPECTDAAAFAAGLRTDPYAPVRVALLAADFAPIELMRFQLALYGMNRFRPSSDSQLRATLFQGAPLPDELSCGAGHGSLFVPRRPAVA